MNMVWLLKGKARHARAEHHHGAQDLTRCLHCQDEESQLTQGRAPIRELLPTGYLCRPHKPQHPT